MEYPHPNVSVLSPGERLFNGSEARRSKTRRNMSRLSTMLWGNPSFMYMRAMNRLFAPSESRKALGFTSLIGSMLQRFSNY